MTHVTSATGPSGPVAFSTVGLPQEQSLELWESHNADALIGVRCRTLTERALEATEINVQLDQVSLARVSGSAHVVERDLALIRRRPTDAVALYFSLVGEAFFYHDDGVRTLAPGQLLVCDADRPFLRGFSGGLEELVLKIPRRLFAEVTGVERVQQPRVVDFAAGANALAHSLARHVGAATRDDDALPADEQALLALVASVLGRGRGPDPAASGAHRAAAEHYIEAHLGEHDLSAGRIAAATGISTRHLSRVFAEVGTTVPRYVLEQRLDAARRLLEASARPGTRPPTIAEVAHRCGFASAAHFSGAFTARFGERASAVRRRAAAARSALPA